MKRRIGMLMGVVGLVAACANGAGATSSARPASPAANPTAAASPSPVAVASIATASATVTFDGTNCKYTGPLILPSPVVLTIDYLPTTPALEGSSQFIAAIKHGTTQADIDRAGAEGRGVGLPDVADPEWVDPWTFHAQLGKGVASYELKVLHDPVHADGKTWPGTYDEYVVSCIKVIPGIPAKESYIIQLIE